MFYVRRFPLYTDYTITETSIDQGSLTSGDFGNLFDNDKQTEVVADNQIEATVRFKTEEPVIARGVVLTTIPAAEGTRYFPLDWKIKSRDTYEWFYIEEVNVYYRSVGDQQKDYLYYDQNFDAESCQEYELYFRGQRNSTMSLAEVQLLALREITEDMVTVDSQISSGESLGSAVKVTDNGQELCEGKIGRAHV